MRGTRLGRLAGIEIAAHWSVLVIVALIASGLATDVLPAYAKSSSVSARWLTGCLVALAFVASLLAHELAHAVTARRHGVGVSSITLWMLGGVTQLEGEARDARSELRIALVGPLTSLLCGTLAAGVAIALHVGDAPTLVVAAAAWLAGTNVLLALFNLLPGAPLDGGRVLRALLWQRSGNRAAAERSAARAGRAVGAGLIALGAIESVATANLLAGLWFFIIGWFLMTAAANELRATVAARALEAVLVRDVMDAHVVWLSAHQPAADAARAAVAEDVEVCAVCDATGRLVGLVRADDLVDAVLNAPQTPVRQLTAPADERTVAAPDDVLTDVLRRAGVNAWVAVVDGEQVVGVVSPARVRSALRRGVVAADRERVGAGS